MKKFKKLLISILMLSVLFVPAMGCGDNHPNIVERFEITRKFVNWDGDGLIVEGKVVFKSDVELQSTYYLFWISKSVMEQYNCNSYTELLKNEEFVESCIYSNGQQYGFSPRSVISLTEQIMLYNVKNCEVILLYETNEIIDKTTDLLNYVGAIKVTESDFWAFENGG